MKTYAGSSMRYLIIFIIFHIILTVGKPQQIVKILLDDGTIENFNIENIHKIGFTNLTDECIMNVFCNDNHRYLYHLSNIDSLNFNTIIENERKLRIIEIGYNWYLGTSKIDSIKFNYLFKAPELVWETSLGGSRMDGSLSLHNTVDSGFVIFGYTCSNNGDVQGSNGGEDLWLVKINSRGMKQWQKTVGNKSTDFCSAIQETTDGGYIVGGHSYSSTTNSYDYIIAKISYDGQIQWQKSYGDTGSDDVVSINDTRDGGYLIAGNSYKNSSPGNHPNDICIFKLNSSGNIIWQKSFGGRYDEKVTSIKPLPEGGYVLAGYSNSHDGDVSINHGKYDYWIVKFDSLFNILWEKSYGGSEDDKTTSICQTFDGGFMVLGYTQSNDKDVVGNHGSYDVWVLRLNSKGELIWSKCLGGSLTDEPVISELLQDGSCIIAVQSDSDEGDIVGSNGLNGIWVVKIDTSGKITWQKPIRGFEGGHTPRNLIVVNDGYIITGFIESSGGDITGHHGLNANGDYWIVKLDLNGEILWQKSNGGTREDSQRGFQQSFDGGYVISGRSYSSDGDVTFNHGEDDIWVIKLKGETESSRGDSLVIELENNLVYSFPVKKINKILLNNITIVNEYYYNRNIISLIGNMPNPFTENTEIEFELSTNGKPLIQVFDSYGNLIQRIECKNCIPGKNNIQWNSLDLNNNRVANGIYYYKLIIDNQVHVKKMILMR